MKYRKQRILTSVLTATALASLLVGCGARNHSETHTTREYHHHLTGYDQHTHSRHY